MLSQEILHLVRFRLKTDLLLMRGKHIFKVQPPSLLQLGEYLTNSAQYEHGLVTLNKPAGISLERGLPNDDSLNPGLDVSIKNVLPSIKQHFQIKDLFSIKIPERNVSGVTVFCDDENVAQEIRKYSRIMRNRKEPADTYHTIVVGEPLKHSGYFDGTISLQEKKGVKRIVLSEDIARNAVKRGEAKRVTLSYKTLASNGETSLLEVQASRVKWNCVRVFLATQTLTPVLGDSLFSTFVKEILGAPVPVDLFSKTILSKQKLPESIMKKLDVFGRKDLIVPLHLHLSNVKLMKKKNESLEISVPFPEIFKWSLDQLGLASERHIAASAHS